MSWKKECEAMLNGEWGAQEDEKEKHDMTKLALADVVLECPKCNNKMRG
jgi:hypothetical protein